MPLEEDPECSSKLILSNLTAWQTTQLPFDANLVRVDLLKIYDHIVQNWMASLPINVPGPARLSKFKVIRQVAIELCLSSLTVSIQNISSAPPAPAPENAEADPGLRPPERCHASTRENSPADSSQVTRHPDQRSDVPLHVSRTPSIHSQTTSSSELKEEPAISRLRQYASSIREKIDIGKKAAFLAHWPSTPGVDPSTYSWEEAQKLAAAGDSADESEHRSRKEMARHRRRTEKFLRQDTNPATTAGSQPADFHSSPQPEVSHAINSQVVDEFPMTQPHRGAFGSRSAQKGKKKQKKQRTAGF